MGQPRFQTLSQFMRNPFNLGPQIIPDEWKDNAIKLIRSNKIRLMQILEYEGSYFYNIEVPSESNDAVHYDVVIQFIPRDNIGIQKGHIRDYYVKFFSNSPGFVYRYAALYYAEGFLIDSLMVKLGTGFLQAPEKTNPHMKLAMDKSIYYAAKLIEDNLFFNTYKDVFGSKRTKDIKKFLDGVLEFDRVMSNIEVEKFKADTQKQLNKDKSKAREQAAKEKEEKRRQANRPGKINVIKPGGRVVAKQTTFATEKAVRKVASRQKKITANAKRRTTFDK